MDIELANRINDAVVEGSSILQNGSPAIVAAGLTVTAYKVAADYVGTNETGGLLMKSAFRSLFSSADPDKGRARQRDGLKKALGAVAATSIALGLTSFSFGAESSFRNGQADLLNTVAQEAGVDTDNTIVVTQGGTDTIMNTSRVPSSAVEAVGGVGFFVDLPQISNPKDTKETMNGILIGLPLPQDGSVEITGLTGVEKGEEVSIGGEEFRVSGEMGAEKAPMRREVAVVSTDVAKKVIGSVDSHQDPDYYGALLPGDKSDITAVQEKLDKQYGEGRFSVATFGDFTKNTSKFMSYNASMILSLFAMSMTAIGVMYESSGLLRRIRDNRKNIAVLKAIGGDTNQSLRPELYHSVMRLGMAAPLSYLIANSATLITNEIAPGLNMEISQKNFLASLALIGLSSIALSYRRGKRAISKISLTSAMRSS